RLAAPTFERMGWGTAFFDADLDGKLDLVFANGHIYPQVDEFPALKETYRQRSQLFLNEGDAFRDVSDTAGVAFRVPRSNRGRVRSGGRRGPPGPGAVAMARAAGRPVREARPRRGQPGRGRYRQGPLTWAEKAVASTELLP